MIDLSEAGFKLYFLKTKLDELSLERKKINDNASRVQEEFKKHMKTIKVELNEEKIKSATSAAKVLWLEQTVSNLKAKLNKKRKLSPE